MLFFQGLLKGEEMVLLKKTKWSEMELNVCLIGKIQWQKPLSSNSSCCHWWYIATDVVDVKE